MSIINDYFESMWKYQSTRHFYVDRNSFTIDNGVFPAYWNLEIKGTTFEVPMFLIEYVKDAKRESYDKIGCSLTNTPARQIRRSATNVFRDFINYSINGDVILNKITTTKGISYYGNPFVILDQDFTPLIYSSIIINTKKEDGSILSLEKPKLIVSPKVLANRSNMVEKHIIQELPNIVNYKAYVSYYYRETCSSFILRHQPIEVVMRNTESLISKATIPTVSLINTHDFNQTILDFYEHQ